MTVRTRASDETVRDLSKRGPVALAILSARRGKLTQFELADRSGVSRSAIAKIELGKVQPRVETLIVLAKALGVRLGDLRPDIGEAV